MIPDDYHDFFLGAVTVAGAVPRVRAGAALAALLDAVFISLVALLPGRGSAAPRSGSGSPAGPAS